MSGFRTTAILGCLLVAFGCNNNPPSPASGAGNGETGPSASSNEPTEDVWTYAESVDRLTGNASGQATRVHPIDNGTAELVAECVMSADAQVKYARIRISFFHGDSKPIAIDRSVGFRDPVHALLRYTTVAGREQRIPVDSTYQNSIDLNLPDIATERQAVEAMLHVATSPTAQEMPHFAGDFAAGFVRADFARIEIPLEGGVTAVIDLQPQAPDLQRLLASCLGNVYAAARPTEVTVPPADHVTIAPTDNRVDNTSGEGGEQRAPDTAGDQSRCPIKLDRDMRYSDARVVILQSGFVPRRNEAREQGSFCSLPSNIDACGHFPETDDCSADGYCKMGFANSTGQTLTVVIFGEGPDDASASVSSYSCAS